MADWSAIKAFDLAESIDRRKSTIFVSRKKKQCEKTELKLLKT